MSLFDRFAAGLETLGKKANQALDEGKLRVELVRTRRRMDNAARELGYLTYRQAKGTTAASADVEALTRRIADAETAAARLEAEIAELKQGKGGSAAGPDAGRPGTESGPAAGGDASGDGTQGGPAAGGDASGDGTQGGPAATDAASPTSSGESAPGS